jgi:predicted nucleic acid-binding protein
MIVFDTDVVSCILGPSPPLSLIRKVADIDPDDQAMTTITVGELVRGALRARRPRQLLALLRARVWPNIRVLSFDRGAAETYGKLAAELEDRGVAIPEAELRIAAICLHHGATLATGETRPYTEIPKLQVEDWIN